MKKWIGWVLILSGVAFIIGFVCCIWDGMNQIAAAGGIIGGAGGPTLRFLAQQYQLYLMVGIVLVIAGILVLLIKRKK